MVQLMVRVLLPLFIFAMWVRNLNWGVTKGLLYLPALFCGVFSSVLFNSTAGVYVFRSWSWREPMLTMRTQSIIDDPNADPDDLMIAMDIAGVLNQYAPNHIKLGKVK